ncbi:MAG: UDP-glucose 4-epimerase GalE [Bacillota bacterium]|nr:UDP-glucose 4-epimerase GalE [Bacillota bacterium]
MRILVTGGAGFIGSHTCVELLDAGYEVVIVDNLCNSSYEAVRRVEEITGKKIAFHNVDLLDREALEEIFKQYKFDAVIHFAGLKAVGESVQIPLRYYHNNITGTLILCELMGKYNVKKIVFSSSATVYGIPKTVPIKEDFPLSTTNPYGSTKLMIEQILRDLYVSDKEWSVVLLRYFNPIGAHKSGLIGENPNGIPNNLMPRVCDAALGKMKELTVWGNDYDTKDGTGVRDYIHVVDLALGHLAALKKIEKADGVMIYNLGTGTGYSVLDIINTFEKVNNIKVPHSFYARRPGDVAQCYSDPAKAKEELGWQAERGLEEMCADAWNFIQKNPKGYEA